MTTDQEYWDKAAHDPRVDEKYIANIDLAECLKAIRPALKGGHILEIGSGVGRLSIPLSRPTQNHIVGVDISPSMRKIAYARAAEAGVKRCRFIDVPTFYRLERSTFNSAYSMLTFQHIGPDDLRRYFKEVARLLKQGGVFRFQFVEGTHHEPQNHNYTSLEVVEWLSDAGLAVKDLEHGLIFPQWTWITAKKGS